MLDIKREIKRFSPLPEVPDEAPALGSGAAAWQEVTKALTTLGMAQYRSSADIKVLLSRLQEMSVAAPAAEAAATALPAAAAVALPAAPADQERTLLLSILPVVDTFDLAYDAVILLGQPAWKEQFDQFSESVTQILEQMGLRHIPGVGSPFDPDVHDAAAVVNHNDPDWSTHAPETVGALYQRGFFWKDRLLRKAQVVHVR